MVPTNNDRDYLGTGMGMGQPATPTGDLLGFGGPQQQQQPQQQVINATHATVSITTNAADISAPSIAGLGKIESTAQHDNNALSKPKKKIIHVPTYSCNGGLDTKVCVSF